MASTPRLADPMGGRQAPRRESLVRFRFGRIEAAATLVVLLYAGLASYFVGYLGLTTSEALVRTARLAVLWDGHDSTLVAFGYERPPLLTLLGLPFAAFEGLRTNGLAAALGVAVGSGISVVAAATLTRAAGLSRPATFLFIGAFALNPLLVYAGVFGLPEAIYASLVLIALSQFTLWLEHQDVAGVIGAGVAISLAFLLRYNVLLVAAVMAWAFWLVARHRQPPRPDTPLEDLEPDEADKIEGAQATMLAFLVPVVFVAGLWTLFAWFPRGEFLGYLTKARNVTMLGADDPAILQRMADFTANPVAVLAWIGGWTLLIAPLSVVAIAWLAIRAVRRRSRDELALLAICLALFVPECIALISGSGHARVTHLFVTLVPAFVLLAYRERGITGGTPPAPEETPRRRSQLAWTGGLALASVVSAGVLFALPATDPPAPALVTAIRSGIAPAPLSLEAIAVSDFIRANAGPGDVLVDFERHAAVILHTGDPSLFSTDADRREEATLYDPFGIAGYILTRRPLPDQGPGRIEVAHPDIYELGSPSVEFAFASGDYRIFTVISRAVPSQ